jgi:hypothetical protein
LDLHKKATFMLKVSPADQNSAKYKFSMYHVDGTDNICTTIQWYKDIGQVIQGLNLQDNPEGMIPLIESVCEASAKATLQDTLIWASQSLNVNALQPNWL